MKVLLPFPDRELNPNSRPHPLALARRRGAPVHRELAQ